MEMVAGIHPIKEERITISCRKRKRPFRIAVLAAVSVLLSWLVYGVTCASIDTSLTFFQALVSPVVLALMALEAIGWFAVILKKDARKYARC